MCTHLLLLHSPFQISFEIAHGKIIHFLYSSAALFPIVPFPSASLHNYCLTSVRILSGLFTLDIIFKGMFFTQEFLFLQLLLIAPVVVTAVDSPSLLNQQQFYIQVMCVAGSPLLFWICVHVGILWLWVHPSDNIHGYIPLSILVVAGRVTEERWLVGVSHRIGLRLHTPSLADNLWKERVLKYEKWSLTLWVDFWQQL